MLYEVKLLIENESKEGVAETLKSFGLKYSEITRAKVKRTLNQNDALHLWFEMLERECVANGITMDMIILKPQEIPVTKHLLKDLFRFIGLKMYKRESTSKLLKDEFSEVQRVFEKTIGERVQIYIPFPSLESLMEQTNNFN